MKRENYISWDELFIGIAELAANRSKDPRTQNGACIVDTRNRVVSIGYNGLPDGCSDDDFPWTSPDKYEYVIHAEANAILNAKCDLTGCKLYLYSSRGYYPCCNCAQKIVQVGINEVICKDLMETDDHFNEIYKLDATKKMFNSAGVTIRTI